MKPALLNPFYGAHLCRAELLWPWTTVSPNFEEIYEAMETRLCWIRFMLPQSKPSNFKPWICIWFYYIQSPCKSAFKFNDPCHNEIIQQRLAMLIWNDS
jgi:hypothetical protein